MAKYLDEMLFFVLDVELDKNKRIVAMYENKYNTYIPYNFSVGIINGKYKRWTQKN